MATSYPYPNPNPNSPAPILVYDWSRFDQGQQNWPIPSYILLILFFILGAASPLLAGRLGITAAFMLAATFLRPPFFRLLTKNLIDWCLVCIGTAIVGNFDAIADLYGDDTFRPSWILLIGAIVLLAFNLKALKFNLLSCAVAVGLFLFYQIVTGLSGDSSILRTFELNGSYMIAFLVFLVLLQKESTRDIFIGQICLVSCVNCGFCLFELVYPYAVEFSISSSNIHGRVVRSAGIYANAITSGLLVTNILLLATVASTKSPPSYLDRANMFALAVITGIGVVVTFSRSAVLVYFLAIMLVAFRFSGNRIGNLLWYIPISTLVAAGVFFGTGEYLSSGGDLSPDAQSRYDNIKEVALGDFSGITRAIDSRKSVAHDTERYWSRPTATGEGFNAIEERGLRPPHSMIFHILTEGGYIGLIGYCLLLLFLAGPGLWNPNSRNCFLFLSILAPIVLLTFESSAFFNRRYFAIYTAMLAYSTRIVMRKRTT